MKTSDLKYLGGSHTTRLDELIGKIAHGLGVPLEAVQKPMQPGDVDRTWADIGKARENLGWSPQVEFDRGLELFLEWFRSGQGHA